MTGSGGVRQAAGACLPGRGRSAYHAQIQGASSIVDDEAAAARYTAPERAPTYPQAELHRQWPGAGIGGDPVFDQFYASQVQYIGSNATTQELNRDAGAALLDKIGPAIIMTHSAGGPFGLLVAEARPNLVKATVIIEGAVGVFTGGARWGMSTIPVTYNPPVSDPADIKVKWVANPEPDVNGYYLQEEPARKLPNLANTAVLFVIADSSAASPGNPGGPAFLKQAGVKIAEEYRLKDKGNTGNSHMMMMDKNNLQVADVILKWIAGNAAK